MISEKAKNYKTDLQKIQFFNDHQEEFFPDSDKVSKSMRENMIKDIDDAFYVYANMKRMNEIELEELRKLNWIDYPENLKIFLFDFCISNNNA